MFTGKFTFTEWSGKRGRGWGGSGEGEGGRHAVPVIFWSGLRVGMHFPWSSNLSKSFPNGIVTQRGPQELLTQWKIEKLDLTR